MLFCRFKLKTDGPAKGPVKMVVHQVMFSPALGTRKELTAEAFVR